MARHSLICGLLSCLAIMVGSTCPASAQSAVAIARPCGPDNIPDFLRYLLPQGFHGADFRDSCRRHDACYTIPGTSRKACDLAFKEDLFQACKSSRCPLRCRIRAHTMYWLVRLTGGSSFRTSQRTGHGTCGGHGCAGCDVGWQIEAEHSDVTSAHIWSDNTGKFQVAADFLGLADGHVQLRRASTGATMTVPLHRLSQADQQFAQQSVRR